MRVTSSCCCRKLLTVSRRTLQDKTHIKVQTWLSTKLSMNQWLGWSWQHIRTHVLWEDSLQCFTFLKVKIISLDHSWTLVHHSTLYPANAAGNRTHYDIQCNPPTKSAVQNELKPGFLHIQSYLTSVNTFIYHLWWPKYCHTRLQQVHVTVIKTNLPTTNRFHSWPW